MFDTILQTIKDHMGAGFVSVLFVLSLAYLAFREKDRAKRCFFLYVPLITLAFYMCPLSLYIYGKVSESVTYYRLLWLIPVTPAIAYTAVSIVSGLKDLRKNLCIAGFVLLFALSGRLMYSDTYMVRAANIYHMPYQVVDICDALHVEGREVMVIMPFELQQFTRQYDPCICLPYGREYMMNIFAENDDLRNAMMRVDRDPYEVGCLAMERGCHYIVVPMYEKFDSLPENYEEYLNIDGYIIYKNKYLSTEV